MKLGIIMPVVLQNETLLEVTLDAVTHLTTRYTATLYVVSNRLHVRTPEDLEAILADCFAGKVRVLHEPGVERSVAGAWNHGCQHARAEGADYIAMVAHDTGLRPECLDALIDY